MFSIISCDCIPYFLHIKNQNRTANLFRTTEVGFTIVPKQTYKSSSVLCPESQLIGKPILDFQSLSEFTSMFKKNTKTRVKKSGKFPAANFVVHIPSDTYRLYLGWQNPVLTFRELSIALTRIESADELLIIFIAENATHIRI